MIDAQAEFQARVARFEGIASGRAQPNATEAAVLQREGVATPATPTAPVAHVPVGATPVRPTSQQQFEADVARWDNLAAGRGKMTDSDWRIQAMAATAQPYTDAQPGAPPLNDDINATMVELQSAGLLDTPGVRVLIERARQAIFNGESIDR